MCAQVGKIVLQFPQALEAHPQPLREEENTAAAAAGGEGTGAASREELEATIAQLRQTLSSMQIDAATAAGETLGVYS